MLTCGLTPAWAQGFPVKPLRLIVGFAPGGTNDIIARALAARAGEAMGQTISVENRAGANTNVAAELVWRAPPDGYTLLFVSAGHAVNPSMYKLPFDNLRDFSFITLAAQTQNVLVVPNTIPAKTVAELIKLVRARPGQVSYGSAGTGSTVHLAGELFRIEAGLKVVHIPYKGTGQALPDLMGGQVSYMFPNMPSVVPLIRAGKLRALAVTGAQRSPALPDVPTMQEAGLKDFDVTVWYAILGPAGMPREIVERLNAEFNKVLRSAEMKERLGALGAEPLGSTPEQLREFVASETRRWARVVKQAGITAAD